TTRNDTASTSDIGQTSTRNRVVPMPRSPRIAEMSALHAANSGEKAQGSVGADLYSEIMLPGFQPSRAGSPIAQNTVFGWILSGACAHQ
ncbi:hypothetical protein ACLKA7_004927, partial [Drosophila subpalustris]